MLLIRLIVKLNPYFRIAATAIPLGFPMTLPGSACTLRERSGKPTSHTLLMMDVQTIRSEHHTNSGLGWNQFGLGSAAKAGGSGARRPELRGNGGCRHRTRPRLQPRRGEGQPEVDPGQFLGELRSVEIQASNANSAVLFSSSRCSGFSICSRLVLVVTFGFAVSRTSALPI